MAQPDGQAGLPLAEHGCWRRWGSTWVLGVADTSRALGLDNRARQGGGTGWNRPPRADTVEAWGEYF